MPEGSRIYDDLDASRLAGIDGHGRESNEPVRRPFDNGLGARCIDLDYLSTRSIPCVPDVYGYLESVAVGLRGFPAGPSDMTMRRSPIDGSGWRDQKSAPVSKRTFIANKEPRAFRPGPSPHRGSTRPCYLRACSAHPLTAPAVMPATICRWKAIYARSGGIVMSRMFMNSRLYWVLYWLWKL